MIIAEISQAQSLLIAFALSFICFAMIVASIIAISNKNNFDIQDQFDPETGEHIPTRNMIKKSIIYPEKYEHIDTSVNKVDNALIVTSRFFTNETGIKIMSECIAQYTAYGVCISHEVITKNKYTNEQSKISA